ncbi:MAG: hypothetical protein AABX04_04085, partial [Nanoarchaeota archaeon]
MDVKKSLGIVLLLILLSSIFVLAADNTPCTGFWGSISCFLWGSRGNLVGEAGTTLPLCSAMSSTGYCQSNGFIYKAVFGGTESKTGVRVYSVIIFKDEGILGSKYVDKLRDDGDFPSSIKISDWQITSYGDKFTPAKPVTATAPIVVPTKPQSVPDNYVWDDDKNQWYDAYGEKKGDTLYYSPVKYDSSGVKITPSGISSIATQGSDLFTVKKYIVPTGESYIELCKIGICATLKVADYNTEQNLGSVIDKAEVDRLLASSKLSEVQEIPAGWSPVVAPLPATAPSTADKATTLAPVPKPATSAAAKPAAATKTLSSENEIAAARAYNLKSPELQRLATLLALKRYDNKDITYRDALPKDIDGTELQQGDPAEVRKLQLYLGISENKADGKWGPASQAALDSNLASINAGTYADPRQTVAPAASAPQPAAAASAISTSGDSSITQFAFGRTDTIYTWVDNTHIKDNQGKKYFLEKGVWKEEGSGGAVSNPVTGELRTAFNLQTDIKFGQDKVSAERAKILRDEQRDTLQREIANLIIQSNTNICAPSIGKACPTSTVTPESNEAMKITNQIKVKQNALTTLGEDSEVKDFSLKQSTARTAVEQIHTAGEKTFNGPNVGNIMSALNGKSHLEIAFIKEEFRKKYNQELDDYLRPKLSPEEYTQYESKTVIRDRLVAPVASATPAPTPTAQPKLPSTLKTDDQIQNLEPKDVDKAVNDFETCSANYDCDKEDPGSLITHNQAAAYYKNLVKQADDKIAAAQKVLDTAISEKKANAQNALDAAKAKREEKSYCDSNGKNCKTAEDKYEENAAKGNIFGDREAARTQGWLKWYADAEYYLAGVGAVSRELSKLGKYQGISNLLFPETTTEWNKWANNEFFNTWSDIPGRVAREVCEYDQKKRAEKPGEGVSFIHTPTGAYQFVGSIQAERSTTLVPILCEKNPKENITKEEEFICSNKQQVCVNNLCYKGTDPEEIDLDTAQPEKAKVYKIHWGVSAPSDLAWTPFVDENGIAVRFNLGLYTSTGGNVHEPDKWVFKKQGSTSTSVIELKNGAQDGGTIVRYLNEEYVSACVVFDPDYRVKDDEGDYVNQICANFKDMDEK